ncbi:MAG: FAD-dependent thymidylate synthase [Oscillospiraceae bacterium]|jgi:thymidylate synthase (FAD)|nr:FAD-dependent thymidylate synthase [Oscillospiraceae bacterium]
MNIIEPSYKITDDIDAVALMKRVEAAGRICYKSEGATTEGSYAKFIASRVKQGHESILEHEKVSVLIVCDRGVSHELVRHRIASYTQESTRYCNYGKSKFGGELTFIRPFFFKEDSPEYVLWITAMRNAEASYMRLLDSGASPEMARSVLPNSIKTEILVTMNLREWRHFFRMRTDAAAHPQMRQLAIPLLMECARMMPPVFGDIEHV